MEDFEEIETYYYELYFDVYGLNVSQAQYDSIVREGLISNFNGCRNDFNLSGRDVNYLFLTVTILKNEYVTEKDHRFECVKTSISISVKKYQRISPESIERVIKDNLSEFEVNWNISYDEQEKVQVWLKQLKRVECIV